MYSQVWRPRYIFKDNAKTSYLCVYFNTKRKGNQVEIWKDIKGYEGLYRVSNFGRVYSYNSNKILKPKKTRGYLYVGLYKKGQKKTLSIHRLVAKNFIDKPKDKNVINHKNAIKTDNRVKNLEWCTQNENIQHAVILKLGVGKALGETRKVSQYDKKGNFINTFYSLSEASKKTGVKISNIYYCCKGEDGRGKVHSAGGSIWKWNIN